MDRLQLLEEVSFGHSGDQMNSEETSYSVVLYDLQPVVVHGLRALAADDGQFSIVGAANSRDRLLEIVRKSTPSSLLADIDVSEPAGLELIRYLRTTAPNLKLILFITRNYENSVLAALKTSVDGFLLKECSCNEILTCLRLVTSGRFYYTPLVSDSLVRQVAQLSSSSSVPATINKLTAMECRILAMIADNKSSREISASLFVSLHTVFTHRRNIATKLGLRGKHTLLKFAIDHRNDLLSRVASKMVR